MNWLLWLDEMGEKAFALLGAEIRFGLYLPCILTYFWLMWDPELRRWFDPRLWLILLSFPLAILLDWRWRKKMRESIADKLFGVPVRIVAFFCWRPVVAVMFLLADALIH